MVDLVRIILSVQQLILNVSSNINFVCYIVTLTIYLDPSSHRIDADILVVHIPENFT